VRYLLRPPPRTGPVVEKARVGGVKVTERFIFDPGENKSGMRAIDSVINWRCHKFNWFKYETNQTCTKPGSVQKS
jgi:hypothetical protein